MNHAHSDVNALRLRYHGKAMPFSVEDACMQIEMRRKTSNKLTWFLKNPGFMFGTSMSAEQATNQNVALFHAQLIGHDRRVLDMTAGLGIDAMTIALNGNTVTAYELERAIRRYETNYRMSNLRAETLAQSLADAVMKGEDFNEQPARQRSVTLDDVRRVAADIFESPSATLVYRPN